MLSNTIVSALIRFKAVSSHLRVVIPLNINEIAKQTGLPYSTARKYLVLLEEAGYFRSSMVEGAREFPKEAPPLVARLSRLSNDGVPLKEAIERLKGGDLEEKNKLDEIENRLKDLTNNLAGISQLLQVELSKLQNVPALPESVDQLSKLRQDILRLSERLDKAEISKGGGFWFHLKAAFGSIFKKN